MLWPQPSQLSGLSAITFSLSPSPFPVPCSTALFQPMFTAAVAAGLRYGHRSSLLLPMFTRGVKDKAVKCVKPGATLMVEGVLVRVDRITQGGKARAGGFVKARVKKVLGGNTFEKTFDSSEMVEVADIEQERVQVGLNSPCYFLSALLSSHYSCDYNSIYLKYEL